MKNNRGLTKIEWIATIIAVTGSALNAFVLKESYYLWIISNSLFIFFTAKHKHYGLMTVFIIQLILTIVGIFYW